MGICLKKTKRKTWTNEIVFRAKISREAQKSLAKQVQNKEPMRLERAERGSEMEIGC